MKVKDLINQLISLPQDSEIFIKEGEYRAMEIWEIKVEMLATNFKQYPRSYTTLEPFEIENYKNDPESVNIEGPPFSGYVIG